MPESMDEKLDRREEEIKQARIDAKFWESIAPPNWRLASFTYQRNAGFHIERLGDDYAEYVNVCTAVKELLIDYAKLRGQQV